jgi:hypothetical protein
MTPLYRRLLGDDFDRMPATLRDFHDIPHERRFQASFKIARGRGRLRGLLCKLGGLPPAGEAVPVRLRVTPDGGRERWQRDFAGHKLESTQWMQDGLMTEQLGPWRLGFELHVEGPALRLKLRRAWLLGVRWPLSLGPRGDGVEVGRDDGVAVVARAGVPLLGRLVQYEGLVLASGE